jgi:hypothetical protein
MKRRSMLIAPAALVAAAPTSALALTDTPAMRPAAALPPEPNAPVLDLRHFGADPSGAGSSDAALSGALAACGESGGTLRFPSGTYVFEQPLNLSGRRSIIILGDGTTTGGAPSASRLVYAGRGEGVFIDLNAAVGVHVRGVQIEHRDPQFRGTYIKCSNIGTNDPAFNVLSDCVLGSHVGGVVHLDLDKCIEFTAERCNFTSGNPSVLGRSASGYSNVIRFRDCQWVASHSAPVRGGGQSWLFSGCTFEALRSGAAGALVSKDATGVFNGLAVVGCWFGDASSGGSWLDIYANGAQISGNYISGSVHEVTGASLHHCVGAQIAGNLWDTLAVAIDFVDGPCRDIVVQGNHASRVTTGFRNADRVATGSLVWAPNYGFGSPGNGHVLLAPTGYCADASSGLIRQWGVATIRPGVGSQMVTFPMHFPGQCLSVVATLTSPSSGAVSVGAVTTFGFEPSIPSGGSGSATLYWQALGT